MSTYGARMHDETIINHVCSDYGCFSHSLAPPPAKVLFILKPKSLMWYQSITIVTLCITKAYL